MARHSFLILSALLLIASASPLQVVDFTYRLKQFELIDTVLDAIALTAKFDQPVYHNVSCPDNDGKREEAVFAPCCAYKNVTGCVASGDDNIPCVDFEHPSLNNTVGYKEWTYFYAHVDNYESCHSVVIENYAIGLSYLAVSVRGIYPQYTSADFLSVSVAGNAQAMCCHEIRRRNPNWNGDLHFGVVGGASSTFDIVLWNSTVLPVERFWFLPTVTVTCDGYEFTSNQCDEGLACFFAPPTSDPLYDVARSMGGIARIEPQSQQFSISLITRRVQYVNIKNSNVVFPFPKARLYDTTCRYYFPSLVNEAGEPLMDSIAPPSWKHVPCTKDGYNYNLDAFRTYVNQLGQLNPQSYTDAGEALLKVLPYVTSDNWTACNELVQDNFLEQSTMQTTITDTTACYELEASETYANDSCCNPNTQLTDCCAPRDVIASVDSFSVLQDNVKSSCSAYRCSLNNLGDYIVLSQSSANRRSGCAARSTQATVSTFNSRKELLACIQNFQPQQCSHDSTCRALDINSVCLPSGQCSIPCQSDSDCITDECITFPYTNITTCRTLSSADLASYNDTGLMGLGLKCMEITLDPIILFYVRQNIGLLPASTRENMIDALIANGTEGTCLGLAPVNNETECKAVESCNWSPCNSETDQYCNEDSCLEPLLGSDQFCGTCNAGLCVEVSTFAHCEYSSVSSDEAACNSVGGTFNGLSYAPVISKRCLSNATTQGTCYQAEFCSSATAACASKCYVNGVASQTQCSSVGAIGGKTPTWTSWVRSGNNYGLCTVDFTDYTSCTGTDARLKYWPGSTWKSGLFNTQSTCEAFGRCDTLLGLYTEQSCTAQSHCVGNEALTDQSACEAPGSCDDFNGCVFPLRSVSLDCPIPLQWTPIGCIDLAISNETQCQNTNGTWVTQATSREECESKAQICFEMLSSGVLSQLPRTGSQIPINYSFKTPAECRACGGAPGNFYSWNPLYYWAPRTFTPFQWRQRQMTNANYWIREPSTEYFFDIVQAAVGRRFAKVLESEMLCRYDQIQSSLQGLVCDCTGTGATDCYDGFSSSVLALDSFCSGVADSFSASDVAISCDTDLKVLEANCLGIEVSVIPISQFQSLAVSSLSAASISSSQAEQRRSALFIKNSAGVTVGQVLSDGFKIQTDRSFNGEIKICLTFPSDFTSDLPLELFDYAVPNEDYTEFVPLGWTDRVSVNGTTCVTLQNTSVSVHYFPVGLQQSWENAAFISTFFPAQVFYLFLGAFLYLLVLLFTSYHFAVHIKLREPERPFFNLSTSALLILILFLMNRFIYMMLIVSGVMDRNGEVEVIFSSFPALLFYVIYSIIVLRWAEIYHFTIQTGQRSGLSKLKPVIIVLNSFLSFAFVLLVILYYSLDDNAPRVVNCATPDSDLNQLTRGDIVAIVYKTFYAAVSITLSVMFVIYGARVMHLVLVSVKKDANATSEKRRTRMRAFEKLLAVSCVCTVCLLAQAAFLLWSSALSSNNTSSGQEQFYGILTFLYVTELPPAVIFVFMFKKTSFFIKAGRHGNLNGSTGSTANSMISNPSARLQGSVGDSLQTASQISAN